MSTLSNTMVATVTIVPPPIKVITGTIIKDATLALNQPYVNFGIGSELVSSSISSTEQYKSIIGVSNISITDIDWDNLSYVRLKLFINSYIKNDISISLYAVEDNKWTETGVNWINAPVEGTLINTQIIKKGNIYATFDLTSYMTNLGNPTGKQYSFMLVGNTTDPHPVEFAARETSTPPKLEIGYLYYPANAMVNDLVGSVTPKFELDTDLVGTMTIIDGQMVSDINGTMHVYWPTIDSDINGTLTVQKSALAYLEGTMKLKAAEVPDTDLSGNLSVVQNLHSDIVGTMKLVKVAIPETDITGSVTVVQNMNYDMAGTMKLVKVAIPETDITGSITVVRTNTTDLNGTMNISKTAVPPSDISGTMTVFSEVKSDISGTMKLKALAGYVDLAGSVTPKFESESVLTGTMSLVKAAIPVTEFTGSLMVKAIGYKDLSGSLTIPKIDVNVDLPGNVFVIQSKSANINGTLIVERPINAEFAGTVTVIPATNETIIGHLTVVQNRYSEINGTMTVMQKATRDVLGSLVVYKDISIELNGNVTVLQAVNGQINGTLYVSASKSYAFIF